MQPTREGGDPASQATLWVKLTITQVPSKFALPVVSNRKFDPPIKVSPPASIFHTIPPCRGPPTRLTRAPFRTPTGAPGAGI